MRCPSCQFDNESGARFCANCGSTIQVTNDPAANKAVQAGCPNCGALNAPDSMFCENCGAQIGQQSVTGTSQTTIQTSTNKTSAAWWLLPFFLMWVGGLIAFLVVREDDKAKAKRLLIFGIVTTFVWIVLYIALAVAIGLFMEM